MKSTGETAERIAAVARAWLVPRNRWMVRAKQKVTAFSPEMVELGLQELFSEISENVRELANLKCVDPPRRGIRPTVCHILSGNLPNPGIVSIIVGLLAGVRNLVKAATGDPMPRLFVESLGDLGKEVIWTDDRKAFRRADIVVAYGTDETIAAIRRRLRKGQKFLGFGHRVSIGVIHSPRGGTQPTIEEATRDVSMWDQQGCMSPQAFYVEGNTTKFAEALAKEMEAFDRRYPRVKLSFDDSLALAWARNEWSWQGKVWASKNSTHWTVVLDEQGSWGHSPLNRFIFIRPLSVLRRLPRGLKFSTIGVQGKPKITLKAERWCPIGSMQQPSLMEPVSHPRVWELMNCR